MPDRQEFDDFVCIRVDDHVRRDDKLARSALLTRPSKPGKSCQLFNAVQNRFCDSLRGGRIFIADVFDRADKLIGCPRRPANLSQG